MKIQDNGVLENLLAYGLIFKNSYWQINLHNVRKADLNLRQSIEKTCQCTMGFVAVIQEETKKVIRDHTDICLITLCRYDVCKRNDSLQLLKMQQLGRLWKYDY